MAFRNREEDRRETNGIIYYDRGTVESGGFVYRRYAVQTHFIEPCENYLDVLKQYIVPLYQPGDIVASAEKIVAMCQNHIVPDSEIKVGFLARTLSKFASSGSHGIGMDEPRKLQLAIDLAGRPRVIFAAVCGAVAKLFGKRGVYYQLVGHGVSGIDGVYERSSFEFYKKNAILNPKEPERVCNQVQDQLGIQLMIVDANDLNVELFAKSHALSVVDTEALLDTIRDNPAGQSDELTPLILIRKEAQAQQAAG